MTVHHLDCGCMCPYGGALFDGFSKGIRACLVCHCLLIETANNGLVLIDTGLGRQDVAHPETISPFFRLLNNFQLKDATTAVAQVERLGYHKQDVRHIILTHLDFDHAGGIRDFPDATVHVTRLEMEQARRGGAGFINRRRFVAEQWNEVKQWKEYAANGEHWFGFNSVRAVLDNEEDIHLVPLAGHTLGHAGIAVRDRERWLLHAGDAYFYRGEIRGGQRACTPGLRFYQWMMDTDREARLDNQWRLRALSSERPDVDIFCSHDAKELSQLSAAARTEPAR